MRTCILVAVLSTVCACGAGNAASPTAEVPSQPSTGQASFQASSATSAEAPAKEASPPAQAAPANGGGLDIPQGDDPWLAHHQISATDVAKTTRAARGPIQACMTAGYKRDSSTNGEVKIRFVITNAGAVRVWRDDGSSMTDEDVTKCIGDVIEKLKFPQQKSPGDAVGIFSVTFNQ